MISKRRIILSAIVVGVIVGVLASYAPPLSARKDIASNFVVLKEKSSAQSPGAKPYTLYQAWEVAQDFALKWSGDAALISLNSVDVDDPDAVGAGTNEGLGMDGRRRSWQAVLTSPRLNKQLFLQIVDGQVIEAIEDGIHDPGIPTIAEKPSIDSPELIRLAQLNRPGFRGGAGRAIGYHFIFESGGTGTAEPTLKVVGSRQVSGQQYPVMIVFSHKTGQLIRAQQYESGQGGAKWTTDF